MKKTGIFFMMFIIILAAVWTIFINGRDDFSREKVFLELEESYTNLKILKDDSDSGMMIMNGNNEKGKETYIVLASGDGYREPISTLTYINPDLTIEKVRIVYQRETKSRGGRVTEDEFLGQFRGKNVEWDGNYDVISGATISSEAVAGSIIESLSEVREIISVDHDYEVWKGEVVLKRIDGYEGKTVVTSQNGRSFKVDDKTDINNLDELVEGMKVFAILDSNPLKADPTDYYAVRLSPAE
jgi:Na+-translocating ferredoxin:NAD+ oxidoreductase RnfG subunit